MTRGNTFVTEVTVDLEHALEATYHQALQIQLWRDTQVHVDVQRVVVSNKRTSRRTARDHLHHRGFDFHKASAHHEVTDRRHHLRTDLEGVTGFFVGDQIQITLAITGFLIGQAVELVRQRTQGLGQQAQFGTVNGQLAGLGFEQLAACAKDIAQVPLLELLVINAFRQIVARNVQLDTAADVLQRHE
ncbi:hypothetical protein D3C79_829720 [compost metagenome]